jgi:hypothetical protein
MRSPCRCVPTLTPFFVCIRCLGNVFTEPLLSNGGSSGSSIPGFRRHVTLHLEFVGRGVFHAVRVVSNSQYVMKRKAITSFQSFSFT